MCKITLPPSTLAKRLREVCAQRAVAGLVPLLQAAADALEAQQPTTADGVRVSPGDTVWVIGSVDVHEARVRPLDALTDYYLFGLLPVSGAYSTEKAALRARHIGQLAGKAGA